MLATMIWALVVSADSAIPLVSTDGLRKKYNMLKPGSEAMGVGFAQNGQVVLTSGPKSIIAFSDDLKDGLKDAELRMDGQTVCVSEIDKVLAVCRDQSAGAGTRFHLEWKNQGYQVKYGPPGWGIGDECLTARQNRVVLESCGTVPEQEWIFSEAPPSQQPLGTAQPQSNNDNAMPYPPEMEAYPGKHQPLVNQGVPNANGVSAPSGGVAGQPDPNNAATDQPRQLSCYQTKAPQQECVPTRQQSQGLPGRTDQGHSAYNPLRQREQDCVSLVHVGSGYSNPMVQPNTRQVNCTPNYSGGKSQRGQQAGSNTECPPIMQSNSSGSTGSAAVYADNKLIGQSTTDINCLPANQLIYTKNSSNHCIPGTQGGYLTNSPNCTPGTYGGSSTNSSTFLTGTQSSYMNNGNTYPPNTQSNYLTNGNACPPGTQPNYMTNDNACPPGTQPNYMNNGNTCPPGTQPNNMASSSNYLTGTGPAYMNNSNTACPLGTQPAYMNNSNTNCQPNTQLEYMGNSNTSYLTGTQASNPTYNANCAPGTQSVNQSTAGAAYVPCTSSALQSSLGRSPARPNQQCGPQNGSGQGSFQPCPSGSSAYHPYTPQGTTVAIGTRQLDALVARSARPNGSGYNTADSPVQMLQGATICASSCIQ